MPCYMYTSLSFFVVIPSFVFLYCSLNLTVMFDQINCYYYYLFSFWNQKEKRKEVNHSTYPVSVSSQNCLLDLLVAPCKILSHENESGNKIMLMSSLFPNSTGTTAFFLLKYFISFFIFLLVKGDVAHPISNSDI